MKKPKIFTARLLLLSFFFSIIGVDVGIPHLQSIEVKAATTVLIGLL